MNSTSHELNLLITSDSKYVPLVGTLLASIHRFLPIDLSLKVYWLHVDNEERPREELLQFCQQALPRCELNISTFQTLPVSLQTQVETLIANNDSWWGPPLCFAAPILLPMILPASVSRAVFVDADVIALGDVSELTRISLDGLPAGCVRTALRCFKHRLGLERYFNSGVVVIDTEAWKNEGVSEASLDYLHKISGSWGANFPDQDALNATLVDSAGRPRWKELHPMWNACSPLYTRSRFRLIYDPVPIKEVKFLHYCGAKPWAREPSTFLGRLAWRKGFRIGPTKPAHPHRDAFFDVLAGTPFSAPSSP